MTHLKSILALVVASLLLFGCTTADNGQATATPSPTPAILATVTAYPTVACTADAKLCPDGSYVGRTGPNCDFVNCPTIAVPQGPTPSQPAPTATPLPTASVFVTGQGSVTRYCPNPSTPEGSCSTTHKYCQPGQVRLICECTKCPVPTGADSACQTFCNGGTSTVLNQTSTFNQTN